MDFGFTDEQRALARKVRDFAEERIAPGAARNDREGTFPPGFFTELGRAGLTGLGIPERHGGRGLGAVEVGIAVEELAKAEVTACYPVLNAALIGGIIDRNGTEEQKAAWLPAVAAGEAVVALVLTEPEHGTDAAAIELRAERDGDGWALTGTKTSIMLGAHATHGLVFARTGEGGARGVTAFYVPLEREGVRRERLPDLGARAGGRATIVFDRCAVRADEVVGEVGEGFVGVMRGFDHSRALIAVMAAASAQAALDEAMAFARERTAFGQPIGRHQGVAFPLVEHATRVRAARLLAYEALWRKDAGLDHRVEANMAKWWAPRVGVEATHQALLTFGHRGWHDEHPISRRMRDAIGPEIADGTENATKLVVARQLLGREHAP
ncbi:acyl-CoA dehydrogenase family protein [Saccharothrix coeruleofusca]|uniref:Acyl-CoA dehydrogenase n=1 Tax=Saccharothrix coeruleofusca TaxID=33919 RepID=A0A918EES1_9PSEU|nr:acyl-CoA dehydrogenase family protein [Saccharothrix coeruleofusca]MBP2334915.1 cyclohexanecarboxyl-CoA dehydrogenase [Saccharothrix coeruleofusca]GGP67910.1 acyl-CoA dehydrogenase [Saccharothrix coeruleofusca]